MGHRKKRRGKKHSQLDSKSKQAIGCQNPAHGQIDEQSKVLSSLTEQIGLFTIPEEDAFATIMTDTTSLLSDGDDDSSDSSWIFTDDASSSNSDVSYSDSICSISSRRSYKDVVANGGTRPPSSPETYCEQAQDVLEAVDIKGKSPLHEPDNWEIVAKKESRKEKLDYPSKQHYLPDDCYQKYRNTASQHWDAANAFYDKARIARASGKWEDAKYFSNQGRMCEEKARQADETASKDIFDSRLNQLIDLGSSCKIWGERRGRGGTQKLNPLTQLTSSIRGTKDLKIR